MAHISFGGEGQPRFPIGRGPGLYVAALFIFQQLGVFQQLFEQATSANQILERFLFLADLLLEVAHFLGVVVEGRGGGEEPLQDKGQEQKMRTVPKEDGIHDDHEREKVDIACQ